MSETTWVRDDTEEDFTMFREAPVPFPGNDDGSFAVPSDLWERYYAAREAFEGLNDELHVLWSDANRRRNEKRSATRRQQLLDELAREGYTIAPPA
jgi:hypothetical protein